MITVIIAFMKTREGANRGGKGEEGLGDRKIGGERNGRGLGAGKKGVGGRRQGRGRGGGGREEVGIGRREERSRGAGKKQGEERGKKDRRVGEGQEQ